MTAAAARPSGPLLLVAVGNPLMTDDGIGLAALERFRADWEIPEGVETVDGAVWPLTLLPQVEDAGAVVFLDAIDARRPPGTVLELERDEIPRFLEAKLSPHQVGVRDLLALCTLRGTLPERTAALGIQPAVVELGTELSPVAARSLAPLMERIAARLAAWGHTAVRRGEAARVRA